MSLNTLTINHISQFTKIQSSHLSRIETSCQNWKFKLTKVNLATSLLLSNTNFSSKLYLTIYQTSLTKYLGIGTFQQKWTPPPSYTHDTKLKLNSRRRILKYFLNIKSKLQLHIRLKLYKTFLKPIWGSTKKSNLNKIQITQNKIYRLIKKVPFYIHNQRHHYDIRVDTVLETSIKSYTHYENSLFDHPKFLAKNLYKPMDGNPHPKTEH